MAQSQTDPDDPVRADFLRELAADPARLLDELDRAVRAEATVLPPPPLPVGGSPVRPQVGVGSELGEYRLVRLIGAGGMGAVYEAVSQGFKFPDQRVAIKVLLADVKIPNADKKFENEFKHLRKLERASNVVLLLGARRHGEVDFIVMPLIDSSLARHLADRRGRPDPWPWVADVVRQIANALRAIAFEIPGLVHRDLTPANVLLETIPSDSDFPHGIRVLVSDFGLAIIPPPPRTGERRRAVLGKARYLSPEYIAATQELSQKSDLFSLGVIAYELLTGRHPFCETDTDPPHVVLGISSPGTISRFRRRGPTCPSS